MAAVALGDNPSPRAHQSKANRTFAESGMAFICGALAGALIQNLAELSLPAIAEILLPSSWLPLDWVGPILDSFALPTVLGLASAGLLALGRGSSASFLGSRASACEIVGYVFGRFGIQRASLKWDRNAFCRGWLITGTTGVGKTESGINVIVHSLCQNERGTLKSGYANSELSNAESSFTKETSSRVDALEAELMPIRESRTATRSQLNSLLYRQTIAELSGQIEPQNSEPVAALEFRLADLDNSIAKIEEQISPLRFKADAKRRSAERHKFATFPFGGLAIDEKGEWWQILKGIFAHYDRAHHLCLLQIRPDWASLGWQPSAQFNILSDAQIPHDTYAEIIVKTAQGIEGGGKSGGGNVFFVTQATTQIGWAIALDRAVRSFVESSGHRPITSLADAREILGTTSAQPGPIPTASDILIEPETATIPNLRHCHKLLTNTAYLNTYCRKYADLANADPERHAVLLNATDHFLNNYLTQADEQLSGVIGTIANYLNYFTDPDVAEIFCSRNSFEFADIDHGLMVCVAMPQKFSKHRRYICAILKLLFYKHALRRFDLRAEDKLNKNLLVVFQDEAQRFIQEDDGNVDILRASSCTTVMATQMHSAIYAACAEEKAGRVTVGNLRNRIIFAAADYESAEESAKFLGKQKGETISRSSGKSGTSISRSTEEKFLVEPFRFMPKELPKFTAYVCHADGAFKRMFIPPATLDNKLPTWLNAACADQPLPTRLMAAARSLLNAR